MWAVALDEEGGVQVVARSKLHPNRYLVYRTMFYMLVSWQFVHCPVVWRKVKTVI